MYILTDGEMDRNIYIVKMIDGQIDGLIDGQIERGLIDRIEIDRWSD